MQSAVAPPPPQQHSYRLRLDTLVRLRWLAILGQSVALLIVDQILGFRLALTACFVVILAAIILNVGLRLYYPVNERLDTLRAGVLLAFDILQLAALLYLTGGLGNPFALMFLAPVLISATTLPPRATFLLGLLAMSCASLLTILHLPLPWRPGEPLELPPVYISGVWTAILLALGFIGIYAWRVANEGRLLTDALTATELVLAREQHLSALDGLAAAAAHELGTPLATIRLVAKELERAAPPGPMSEDVALLREQVDRCRDILRKITSLHDDEGTPFEVMSLSHVIEEVAAPHRDFGVEVEITARGKNGEPALHRNPALLYGLGNFVENAVDFANEKVIIRAEWDSERVWLDISDDGPGFAQEVLAKLGEPYVTTRSGPRPDDEVSGAGLGLGVFIAKTLLERSGANVAFGRSERGGARVSMAWPRSAFDAMVRH
jgi:two-component system sensor histidine kinase RegB